jgi:chorismate-pyruvate lyase
MSRMSRLEWFARVFTRGTAPTKQRTKPTGRAKRIYRVILPDSRSVTIEALTRSEARSLAKEWFDLPAKGRLPIGTMVTPESVARKVAS